MKVYKTAVIAGSGIGPEVLAEGIKVLERIAEIYGIFRVELFYFPWGIMDDHGVEQFSKFDQFIWRL